MAKDLKISKEQILKIEAAARREADIEFGLNFNRHRVHKSKKLYSRKGKGNKIEY
jgi:hypothetical protein